VRVIPEVWRAQVRDELERTRQRTLALLEPLDDELVASAPPAPMGPIVWDLGHLASYEERWCVRALGLPALEPALDELYDAFETPRMKRAGRALLDRSTALDYMARVRERSLEAIDVVSSELPLAQDGLVFRMIAQHECQHQETLLQVLQLVSRAPALPLESAPRVDRIVRPEERVAIPAGAYAMGTRDRAGCWDNERGEHLRELDAFELDKFPVTNERWRAFVEDDGYQRPELWTRAGWAWRERESVELPFAWRRCGGDGLRVLRLGHELQLEPLEPVQHVSYHEAEAFASWAGGRLPSEAEWEKAAAWDPARPAGRVYPWGEERPDATRANLGAEALGPAQIGSFPAGASYVGAEQMIGDVYEWTSSPFEPYPGFQAFPYAEYSEVFFGDSYRVLRGGSWAAGAPLARNSYRNWDLPQRRQLFCGLRLAWDAA